MTPDIHFVVWSPNESTFWQSWVTAGICTAPYEFTEGYAGCIIWSTQSDQGWTPLDDEGNPIPGWHGNFKVFGTLAAEMTHAKDQYDAEGNLLSIWDRTWAALIFNLDLCEADPETGFPAGYCNSYGVTYADARDVNSPSNVWA